MKKAMSNVDVAAVVDELQEKLVGGFVGKSYQLSPDRVVISFSSPDSGKLDLLLEAGRRIHLTEKPREA
ncbi:MAG TPA: NFACT family protein, partial [Methanothrix sp.]|nr:NFACT family protein [Methanothrix sp.]